MREGAMGGFSGFIGTGIWVFLTANWPILFIFATLIIGTIFYIMFRRESEGGERADTMKHRKRMAKQLEKQWKKQGREQPTRDYGQYNLDPRTINPPPLVPDTTPQPKPRPGPSKPSGS